MRTRARLVPGAIIAGALLGLAPHGADAQELNGGWIIADWEWAEGADRPAPSRGIFLFTESGHYSIQFVIGEPREALGPEASDADIAAAYGPFVSNAGRYTVSGNTITYEAYVAKDPAYMSSFAPTGGEGNEQTIEFSFSGDSLMLTFGEGGPMGGATATLMRPGGGD